MLCSLAMIVAVASPAPAAAQPSVGVILNRLIAAKDGVKSYTASVQAHVDMHTFPYLSPTLEGTYYHKEPSMNKVVFTSGLPSIAQQFSKVYPQIESPEHWAQKYLISIEQRTPTATVLKLVPRVHGRVDHIDATIVDRTADLVQLRWNYNDGGYALLNQTYSEIDGHRLVTQQSGHFEVPNWNADLTSTFSAFKINAPIPDSVFADNS